MKHRASPQDARWAALVAALVGVTTVGLGQASCTLNAEGTAPNPASTGGGGPGTGGGGGELTTSGGGQGGSGGVSDEDCLDGADNDQDGAVDCEDSDCNVGYECVDSPVDGWTGYARVQQVDYPAASPPEPCPDGSMPAIYLVGEAGPAACASCACDWTGAECTAPELRCWFNSGICGGPAEIVSQLTGNACVPTPPTPSQNYGVCQLGNPAQVANPGTCSALGGEITNPLPWQKEVRVCGGAAGGGCDAGQACAPKAPTGFEPAVCMTQAGDHACPAGWTGVDIDAYDEDFTDDRACTGCGCDTATVTCTGGKYTLYDDSNCNPAGSNPIDVGFICMNASNHLDNDLFSYRPFPGTPQDGICNASAPTGALQKSGGTQICCQQPPGP